MVANGDGKAGIEALRAALGRCWVRGPADDGLVRSAGEMRFVSLN